MSKYIKIEDLRLHLQNLVLDGERLDPKTTRLIIMTLKELPIHEFDDESATTTDCISRQQAVEAVTNTIREKFSLADWYEQLVETGLEIENLIKELPSVTPTDKVIDFNNMISAGGRIRNLPPVTPTGQQEHGRLIDADALIESIKQSADYKNDVEYLMYANSFIDDINNAPTVITPTERAGEWEETESKDRPHHLCIQELSKVCNDCKLYWRCPYLKKEFGGDDNE